MQYHKYPSSSYARILFRHLRLSEATCEAYFAGTNVSYKELMTLDGTIPRNDLVQIYRNAMAISDVDDLGLSVGPQLQLSAHGSLGVATLSGPDLRTCVNLLAKYSQTRTDFLNITISEHAAGMTVGFNETFDLDDLRVFATEAVLIGFFSAINFIICVGQFEGRVCFAYAKPDYWRKYQDHFGDNIKFNRSATEITVPASILSIPSPTADALMHQESVATLERQLKELNVDENGHTVLSAQQAVTKLIVENPAKIWTLSEVSEKLSMSSRTLIRKLDAEGVRFQSVRDEVAKKQVASYLKDTSLSVESIGHLMGFSDVSSFRRSFKRGFGETPSQYIARDRGP